MTRRQRERLRRFLTRVLRDTRCDPFLRLEAIDVLNEIDGLYIQKHEHAEVTQGATCQAQPNRVDVS